MEPVAFRVSKLGSLRNMICVAYQFILFLTRFDINSTPRGGSARIRDDIIHSPSPRIPRQAQRPLVTAEFCTKAIYTRFTNFNPRGIEQFKVLLV